MTDTKDQDIKKRLGLAKPGTRLELRSPGGGEAAQVRQSFPHGRTKTVQVEVKKKRIGGPGAAPAAPAGGPPSAASTPAAAPPAWRREPAAAASRW